MLRSGINQQQPGFKVSDLERRDRSKAFTFIDLSLVSKRVSPISDYYLNDESGISIKGVNYADVKIGRHYFDVR